MSIFLMAASVELCVCMCECVCVMMMIMMMLVCVCTSLIPSESCSFGKIGGSFSVGAGGGGGR